MSASRSTRHEVGLFSSALLAGTLVCGGAGCSRKANAVACTVTYGGEARRLEFPATSDAYGVKAFDIAGRFRFTATYVREPWRAASINVYAYQQVDGGNVLLQEGKYTPPFSSRAGARYGFTGRQLVYSPAQRELEYWCELSP
jgi:hypothetical protein